MYYWLGLLNSKVFWWYLKKTGYVLRGGYYVFKTNNLSPFPCRLIDFSAKEDKKIHDKIAQYAKDLVESKQILSETKVNSSREILIRRINHMEEEINIQVYELYGLSNEEIKIVEATNEGK